MVITTDAGKDVAKQEPLYTAGGNANQYNQYVKLYSQKTRDRTVI
jgi:hypothetical protein